LFCVFLCVSCVSAARFGQCEKGHPVFMIPGIFGTVLNMEADIPADVPIPSDCKRKVADHRFWIHALDELHYSCFSTYFGHNYSSAEKKWERVPGVKISVPEWGKTFAVDTLDPSPLAKYAIPYYHNMIKALEKRGYVDGVNMAGGGFLWYEPPSDEWAKQAMELIENLVNKNNGVPAIIVSHSMGAPVSYYLIKYAGDAWVKKYVHKLIYVSPAWLGAVKALDIMFDGFDYFLPIAGKYFAPLARHLPGCWMLLPWGGEAFKNMTLATTPSRKYTFDQLVDLLTAAGAGDVAGKLKATQGVFEKWNHYSEPPPVPVVSYMGYGKDTVVGITFKNDIKPADPDGEWTHDGRVLGNGDGTVPEESLRYVTDKWASMGVDVTTHFIKGGEHLDLLRDSSIVDAVVDEAC